MTANTQILLMSLKLLSFIFIEVSAWHLQNNQSWQFLCSWVLCVERTLLTISLWKKLQVQEVEIMLKIWIWGISMHIHLNMTMFLRWMVDINFNNSFFFKVKIRKATESEIQTYEFHINFLVNVTQWLKTMF